MGLGRAVAVELAKQGAHVTVVARTESTLKETVELMKVLLMLIQVPYHYTSPCACLDATCRSD